MSVAGIAPAWTAAAPALVLAGTGLFLLILDAIYDEPSNTLLAGVGVAGSLVTLGISVSYMRAWLWDPSSPGGPVFLLADAIKVDGMALFFTAIFASVTSLVLVAAHDYMADRDSAAEFYSLVLFAATGMSVIAISNSLATVFIAWN
jgi:NADH:ubiquinone oxidoreductase subunit 2 (chain N)